LIQGLHDNWNGHEYTSASLSTENKVKLTYGRYEMRAKIDVRSGSRPAWWVWSRPDAGGWPKEGEIDMMEYYTGKCLFNVVDGNGRFYGQRRKIAAMGGDRWAREFHVWTMDWDSAKIDLYLDGTLMYHFPVDLANGTGLKGANPYRNPETKKMILSM
jgi:beta-glucanase (GH16 family)